MSYELKLYAQTGEPLDAPSEFAAGIKGILEILTRNGVVTRNGTQYGYNDLNVRLSHMRADGKPVRFMHPSGAVILVTASDKVLFSNINGNPVFVSPEDLDAAKVPMTSKEYGAERDAIVIKLEREPGVVELWQFLSKRARAWLWSGFVKGAETDPKYLDKLRQLDAARFAKEFPGL